MMNNYIKGLTETSSEQMLNDGYNERRKMRCIFMQIKLSFYINSSSSLKIQLYHLY